MSALCFEHVSKSAHRGKERPDVAGNIARVDVWFDYRRVWAGHPWLAVYAVIVVLVLILAIVGTAMRNPLAILFIPALAGGYIHHMMVMKRVP
jgi:hypothetical protein